MEKIKRFEGKFRFFSNFWLIPITYENVTYPSVEHAYQASKTLNPLIREKISHILNPGKAKKFGKNIILRKDWDNNLKLRIMKDLIQIKFRDSNLRKQLLDTGNVEIIEGNDWNDFFWGVCDGRGENHLGKILMQIREKIKGNINEKS